MPMNQFRRSVVADTSKKGGKGSKGSWYEKLNLPKNTPTPFLLIDASYVDNTTGAQSTEIGQDGKPVQSKTAYFKFRKHKRKLFLNGKEQYRDSVCSAGNNPHNPQPCAGCQAMDSGDKSVTTSDTFAIGLVHLHPYHGHPILDTESGQYIPKKDGSGLVLGYDPCEGRNCNYCKVMQGQVPTLKQGETFPYNAKDITTVFGRRRYLELGKNHLADLVGWDQQVGSVCYTIHGKDPLGNPTLCGEQLSLNGYSCPHCKSLVIDAEEDPRSDEELTQAVMSPYPCLTCQKPVLLQEVVSCGKCDAMNEAYVKAGHPNPNFKSTQLNLFDVVLWGFKQGENTNSHLHLSRAETVEQFAKSVPSEIMGGKSVPQVIVDLAKAYDFDEIFKPRSFEDQVKRLSLNIQSIPQAYGVQTNTPFNQGPTVVGGPAPVVPQGGYAPTSYPMAPPPVIAGPNGNPGPAPFIPVAKPNFGKQ